MSRLTKCSYLNFESIPHQRFEIRIFLPILGTVSPLHPRMLKPKSWMKSALMVRATRATDILVTPLSLGNQKVNSDSTEMTASKMGKLFHSQAAKEENNAEATERASAVYFIYTPPIASGPCIHPFKGNRSQKEGGRVVILL